MSTLEIIAVLFTFICVALTARQNIWCWPTGIVGVIAFFLVFLEQKLYAETTLQVIFLLQSLYGWYNWVKGRDSKDLPVSSRSLSGFGLDVAFVLLLAVGFGYLLDNNTDTTQPYLDATTACISLLANWYLVKKRLQAWILWIAVDILLMVMFINQGLNLSAILYVVLLGFSTHALILWKRDLKTA